MSWPGLSNPGVWSCCPYCKNRSTGMMSALQGVLTHHSGLICFMDPLPGHVVNESRNYKHQASSMPCCIDRQVTVKSQAWTSCGRFWFSSKGTSEAACRRTSGNTRKATQALTSDVLPCLPLPFQDFPKKPSREAAEGLPATPGSTGMEPTSLLHILVYFYLSRYKHKQT